MPLAASGTISIGGSTATRSINLELSRAAGASSSLNEAALRTLAGVPSGAISLSNFYGKSSYAASLVSNITAEDGRTSGTASAGINVFSGGTYNTYGNGGGNAPPSSPGAVWKTGGGTGADYEVRLTLSSGSLSNGNAAGVWHNLGANVLFGRTRSSQGLITAIGTLEIRVASTQVVVASTAVNGVYIAAEIIV